MLTSAKIPEDQITGHDKVVDEETQPVSVGKF